jgi:hypothetical protein
VGVPKRRTNQSLTRGWAQSRGEGREDTENIVAGVQGFVKCSPWIYAMDIVVRDGHRIHSESARKMDTSVEGLHRREESEEKQLWFG